MANEDRSPAEHDRSSVEASGGRAHFCLTAFSRGPFVVNVFGGFERGGALLLPTRLEHVPFLCPMQGSQ